MARISSIFFCSSRAFLRSSMASAISGWVSISSTWSFGQTPTCQYPPFFARTRFRRGFGKYLWIWFFVTP